MPVGPVEIGLVHPLSWSIATTVFLVRGKKSRC